jgi:hypothetical protein
MTDPDRPEYERAKRQARQKRAAFKASPESGFARTMRLAMVLYLEARARNVPRETAIAALEHTLRLAWKSQPSQFAPNCQACGDIGWIERVCRAEDRCNRPRCSTMHPAYEHSYVIPCVCAAGQRKHARPSRPSDALVKVGQTRKRLKGLSRITDS